MDFVHDTLHSARRISALNIVDDFTREAVAIEVDTSSCGSRVVNVLDRLVAQRGVYPETLVMDNELNAIVKQFLAEGIVTRRRERAT